MYEEHPVFNPPPAGAVLWRYMDFTKFVSILDKRALFFARADKLGDPFEGSFSKVNEKLRPEWYGDNYHVINPQLVNHIRESRRFTLINCWHESIHESEAMWRLYAREGDGIAIKTDFDSFKKSFTCNEKIYIGRVSYIDYENDVIPESNTFYPYLYKRQSFEHEHELRAIVQTLPSKNGSIDYSQDTYDVGEYYKVDLSLLIKEVVVAPFAPDWFLELVNSVAALYTLKVSVVKSVLADNPTWG